MARQEERCAIGAACGLEERRFAPIGRKEQERGSLEKPHFALLRAGSPVRADVVQAWLPFVF